MSHTYKKPPRSLSPFGKEVVFSITADALWSNFYRAVFDSKIMLLYGKDELVDQSTCGMRRADLKMCLLMSDCCLKLKKTPRECLKNPEGMVPNECFMLRNAFFECKRSLIDMRARFRGIKT